MSQSSRLLLTLKNTASLEARLAVMEQLYTLECPSPYTLEMTGEVFDAPDGKRLGRVYVVDLPKSLGTADESALVELLRESPAIQHVTPL